MQSRFGCDFWLFPNLKPLLKVRLRIRENIKQLMVVSEKELVDQFEKCKAAGEKCVR